MFGIVSCFSPLAVLYTQHWGIHYVTLRQLGSITASSLGRLAFVNFATPILTLQREVTSAARVAKSPPVVEGRALLAAVRSKFKGPEEKPSHTTV
jgi:hypothetical protein